MTNPTPSTTLPNIPEVAGIQTTHELVGLGNHQGHRLTLTTGIPLPLIPKLCFIPDPEVLLPDNRRVDLKHAEDFATYVRMNPDTWTCPSILLHAAPGDVKFERVPGSNGTNIVGVIKIDTWQGIVIKTLDGQHRILGLHLLFQDLNQEITEAKSHLAAVRRQGIEGNAIANAQRKVDDLVELLAKLSKQALAVQIVMEDDPSEIRQMFTDIASNAKGITKPVQGRFDRRKVVNRAAAMVLEDPPVLLADRIDLEKDRVVGSNPNILAFNHVANVVHHVAVGYTGRVSPAQEKLYAAAGSAADAELADAADKFFGVITEAFPALKKISIGATTVEDSRQSSLLLSVTMLQILAGVYYSLKQLGRTDEEIKAYFAKLAPHMDAPVTAGTPSGDLLIGATPETGAFQDGATAPGARAQQAKEILEVLVDWESNPPADL